MGQVWIRVVLDTTRAMFNAHVHRFTLTNAQMYTTENLGYNHLIRPHLLSTIPSIGMLATTMTTAAVKAIELGRRHVD